jgi:energy-coupling factor transporter ATP-binding protein EcfA2
MWTIDQIEINGGFLPGLKTALPNGLICIIGPRGSGKSTLAETLRFALKGNGGAPKKRLDRLQANLGNSGLITLALTTDATLKHTLRRGLRQPPALLTADDKPVSGVDIDRGTYLPVDAYNSDEIEGIADQVLGETRRALLDELRSAELSAIHLSLGEHRRALTVGLTRPTQVFKNCSSRPACRPTSIMPTKTKPFAVLPRMAWFLLA